MVEDERGEEARGKGWERGVERAGDGREMGEMGKRWERVKSVGYKGQGK